jgi:Zn-dependent M28 family amino/carboxypeptidase
VTRRRQSYAASRQSHITTSVRLTDFRGASLSWPRLPFSRPHLSPEVLQTLAARLRTHVDILAGLIGPRHLGKPSSMQAATAYIERQFAKTGDAVTLQTYPVFGSQASNLVVERLGTHSPKQILVVGAHYDTVPETPGADDNASAVAMLLEVARLLPKNPHRTVRFVAFACEEPPHFYTQTMGSDQYARACRKANERLLGMICLEMVGYFSTTPKSQRCPEQIPRPLRRFFPSRGNFLTAVSNFKSFKLLVSFSRGFKRTSPLPLFSVPLPERINEIRLSDHASFWDFNYPALMLTDTSFFRNPNYHLPSDTPDTLDYDRLAQATLGVTGAVAHIAQCPGPRSF